MTSIEQAREARVDTLFPKVDSWGAKEWFQRLVLAVNARSEAVRAGDDMAFKTHNNIASSSATRLVADYADQVVAALSRPVKGEPVAWVKPDALVSLQDPFSGGEAGYPGVKLPARKTAGGRFTEPLYSAPPIATVKAEPVAWQRYSDRSGRWSHVDADYAQELAAGGETVRPLYAAPFADSEAPTTPVDGVGAEPFFYGVIDAKGAPVLDEFCVNADAEELRDAWDERDGYTVVPLYAAPLASPEAEARLRERGQSIDWWMREKAPVDVAEYIESLEARLAQAERVPAVTEAMVNAAWNEGKHRRMAGSVHDFRAILEAALQQSAAGEEGKP